MLYAVMLTLCMVDRAGDKASPADQCGTYVINIDTDWHTKAPCMEALVIEGDRIADVWKHDSRLAGYLASYNIALPVGLITDYDLTCERIADQEIP